MNIGFICMGNEEKMTGVNRYSRGILEQIDGGKYNKYCFGHNYFDLDDICEIHGIYENTTWYDKVMKERYLLGKMAHIDIIHSFYRPLWLEKTDIKTVITIHDLAPLINLEWCIDRQKLVYELFDVYLRKSAQMADKIIAVSESTKDSIINIYDIPEEKIAVISPAVSYGLRSMERSNGHVEKIKHKFSIDDDYLLSICTLQPRKNVISLIEAYEIYRDKNKESGIKLVLTGQFGWKFDGIIRKIKNSKYTEDIILTGYVEENEMASLYEGAIAFAYISYFEGFGMPVLEALHYGKAVLTSNTTSMPEVGGNAAVYCDPYDLESIYTSLEYLLDNKECRQNLQEKAALQAEKFSYRKSAEKLENIFSQLSEIN